MPSGSKKRKAAKKKKENQFTNHQNPSSVSASESHGSDDVGEVSSPLSLDGSQSHRNLQEEVIHEEKDIDSNILSEGIEKTNTAVDEVLAEREVGIEGDSNRQKRPYDGCSSRSSSSSSSSSDSESNVVKSGEAAEVVDSAMVPNSLSEKKDETSNSVAVESVNKADALVENKVSSSVEKAEVDAVKSTVEETREKIGTMSDDQLIMSYNVPVATCENGAEHARDSGVTEPVVHSSPHPVQTTSWKSCCGLFDVFAGSGR